MKLVALIFLCISPIVASAQTFTEPVRINTDTTGTDREPWMHVHNGKIYVSWVKVSHGVAGNIYFSRSDDGGATWMASSLAAAGNVNADLQRGAPFAVDLTGNIHMVWVEKRVGDFTDVWYTRSTDGGTVWASPTSISDDSSLYMQDFPSVACDSSGNVYVSFLDSRDRTRGTSSNEQLYLVKSTNGGVSWTAARRINQMPNNMGGTCECCKQDIQAGRNGIVAVAFRTNIMNRRDIFAIRSTDFGETFTEAVPIQAQPWNLPACPATGPNAHLTPDGEFHVTWRDSRNAVGKPHVYYDVIALDKTEPRHLSLNNVRVDVNEVSPNWPDVSFYNGYTAITYETSSNRATYALLREDLGQLTFGALPKADNKMFMCTEFAADGTRYFAWQDEGFATDDILFMKDIMPLEQMSVDQAESKTILAHPNPVRGGNYITIDAPETLDYSIVDLLGRIVYQGKIENNVRAFIPMLTNGNYMLRVGMSTFAIMVTD